MLAPDIQPIVNRHGPALFALAGRTYFDACPVKTYNPDATLGSPSTHSLYTYLYKRRLAAFIRIARGETPRVRRGKPTMLRRPNIFSGRRVHLLVAMAFIAGLIVTTTARAADPEPKTKKVALLVGVDKYFKAGFTKLDYPEADVEAVAVELRRLGFQVTILKGSSEGKDQATLENIESTAKALVAPLGADDLMLVMLSGHGQQLKFPDPADPKKEKDDGFFCPYKAVPSDPKTLFSLSHLTDDILAPNVGKKLVLIDACRDVPKDPGRGAKGIQGKTIALPENTAVLFGCRSGQQSYENEKLGHGLFTHCLLEGLQGKAAREGKLTWTGLAAFVEGRLSDDDMKTLMPKSSPQEAIAAGGVGQLVLARIDVKPIGGNGDTPPALATGAEGKKSGDVRDDNGLKLKLVWCEKGRFTMGSPKGETGRSDDEDQVSVILNKGFWFGQTSVTQAQFKSVLSIEPWKGKELVKEGATYPVTYVNWDEATEFCANLTERESKSGRLPKGWKYALPTEAQREYACRAGTTTAYVFGDDPAKLGEYAWYDKNAWDVDQKYAHAVATKQANAWGLYDMQGNVLEWCGDYYGEKLPGGTDPFVGTGSNRMHRGGSWRFSTKRCRSADRDSSSPVYRSFFLGFRVALVPSSK